MNALASATIFLGWVFLGAMAMLVITALLRGGISLRGLLRVKSPGVSGDAEALSPARVQLLIATLATAATYLSAVMAARGTGHLPDVDTRLLYGIGASQGLYLASKLGKFVSLIDVVRGLSP